MNILFMHSKISVIILTEFYKQDLLFLNWEKIHNNFINWKSSILVLLTVILTGD